MDGRYVAFQSSASSLGGAGLSGDVFMHDRQTATTTLVSVTNAGEPATDTSSWPTISADGRYVSFGQVYVHDRNGGRTDRVNVATDGTPAAGAGSEETSAVSDDGRYVVFDSSSTNLVDSDNNQASDIFVRDRQSVPGVPAVYVGNATVHEGDAGTRGAVFTVTLSGLPARPQSLSGTPLLTARSPRPRPARTTRRSRARSPLLPASPARS